MDVMNLALSLGLQVGAAVLLAVLAAGAARLANHLADWLRLSADDKARQALLAAVNVAVAAAEAELRRRYAGAPMLGLDAPTKDAVVRRAADYVAERMPGALTRLKVDDAGLHDIIDRRLAARQPG